MSSDFHDDAALRRRCSIRRAGKIDLMWDRELTPEENLFAAVIERAISDAQGRYMGFEAKFQRYNQTAREARKWFRDRSQTKFGWGWIIEHLKLSPISVRKIEQRAFLEGRY